MIFQKEDLQLPKHVTPCPIVETTCEVRFTSDLPPDAVFGACYTKLSGLVGKAIQLPILGLPPEVREREPNLRFQPYHRFENAGLAVQLGPRVFAVSSSAPYPGWAGFAPTVKERVAALAASGVIAKVSRLGLRYINYLEGDVFEKIDVEVTVNARKLVGKEMSVAVILANRYSHRVRIRKDVTVRVGPARTPRFGSVIDIDSFMVDPKGGLNDFDQFLEEAHVDEKTIFFGMLKQEFLATLNPIY